MTNEETDMSFAKVIPILSPKVRELCARPYHGHPKGCPNYGKRPSCPPAVPLLGDVLDLGQPVYAVWNIFDFGGHVARMRNRHPEWSTRQCECCLYWQGTARKQLRRQIWVFFLDIERRELARVIMAPEAHGVDVTATMASLGHELEWPPKTVAYQVALVGKATEGREL